MATDVSRAILASERSGVLHPSNLERFSARWIAPSEDVREVVDTYWAVDWRLRDGEAIDQPIIDHPSITLTIERGRVRFPYVVSAARKRAWTRTISGSGSVFAIRLRPAGLAVVSDLSPSVLVDEEELTDALDGRSHRLLRRVAESDDAEDRAVRADQLIGQLVSERPLTPSQRLANASVDEVLARPEVRRTDDLARSLGVGVRTLQRALSSNLGRGVAEVARRVRLQEAVRRLSERPTDIASIAGDLGFVDQAHLINDFRRAAGVTPGAYLKELALAHAALTAGSEAQSSASSVARGLT